MEINRFFCVLVLWVLGTTVYAGLKIDTIYFQDGDRITGEVLSLKNNQLSLKTDDGGVLGIEWKKVDSVMILNTMRIVMDDGKIIYGQVHTGDEAGTGTIRPIGEAPMWVYLVRIVSLTPVEERFFDRLTGLFSSGFSYAKATEVMHFTLSAELNYEAELNHLGIFYDGNQSEDPASGHSERQKGGLNYRRYLPKKFLVVSQFSLETNTELGLYLRSSLEAGMGNSLLYSNSMQMTVGGGLLANREISLDQSAAYNLEAIFTGEYNLYIYESPDIRLTIYASLIPSLNQWGRIRSEVNSNLRWEIFNDFFLKWTFYYSFDSQPLSQDAAKTDWAITMLGLEYRLK